MISKRPWADPAAEDRSAAMSEALFRSHAQAVFAVCLANTQHYHDAEDLVQAVFLKAIAKASTVQELTKVRAWLLQIARRTCVDFHRRRKPMEMLLDDPPAPPPSDTFAGQRLHEAIQKLPQSYREAIVLYYLDGHNCARVAASLATTESAVRQRLVRARAMLHDFLQEEQP